MLRIIYSTLNKIANKSWNFLRNTKRQITNMFNTIIFQIKVSSNFEICANIYNITLSPYLPFHIIFKLRIGPANDSQREESALCACCRPPKRPPYEKSHKIHFPTPGVEPGPAG